MDETEPPLDLPRILRALRGRADLSQRQLAERAGLPHTQVARIEAGTTANPRLHTVRRLVHAAGARLAVVDIDGSEPVPLLTDIRRDAGGRRYPPHLDIRRASRWRGIRRTDVTTFRRARRNRDLLRREAAGEQRAHGFTEIRRLGPGDTEALASLRADAAQFDLAGRQPPVLPRLDDDDALRYLRDPAVRHWVAEVLTTTGPRIDGHLVAHVHLRHAAPPAVVVTEVGLRPAHRAGPLGPLLAQALRAEAARLGARGLWALTDHPEVDRFLRSLNIRTLPVTY